MIFWIAIVLTSLLILALVAFIVCHALKKYNPDDYPPVPYSKDSSGPICIHHEVYDSRDDHP